MDRRIYGGAGQPQPPLIILGISGMVGAFPPHPPRILYARRVRRLACDRLVLGRFAWDRLVLGRFVDPKKENNDCISLI